MIVEIKTFVEGIITFGDLSNNNVIVSFFTYLIIWYFIYKFIKAVIDYV